METLFPVELHYRRNVVDLASDQDPSDPSASAVANLAQESVQTLMSDDRSLVRKAYTDDQWDHSDRSSTTKKVLHIIRTSYFPAPTSTAEPPGSGTQRSPRRQRESYH